MRFVLPLAIVFLLAACRSEQKTESSGEPQSRERATNGGSIGVEAIDESGFEKLTQERNGKMLLLNVWATWCIPCKEEFPDLVRLAEDYRNRDVEIVGLSVDYPDEVESRIKPFLQEQNINFKVYVADFKDQDEFINNLNPGWSGALPATFVFDASGKQTAFLLGKHSYEEFRKVIEER